MVVYHAGGLHVGVANGGTEKFEAALFHILTYRIGYGSACGNYVGMINDRLAIWHKAIQVFIK